MYSIAILMMYVIWGGFVALILFALYKVLSALLDKYLVAKEDQTAAIREQNQALREIATAIAEKKNNDIGHDTNPMI